MKKIDYQINSLYITRTYAGCLEGPPKHTDIIASTSLRIEQLWGKRNTYVIEPKLKDIPVRTNFRDKIPQMLPQWQHALWVDRWKPINKDADGSQLVIIWWDDEVCGSTDIHSVIETVEWDKYASDFWY